MLEMKILKQSMKCGFRIFGALKYRHIFGLKAGRVVLFQECRGEVKGYIIDELFSYRAVYILNEVL